MWNGPGNLKHQRLSNGAEMCHTSSGKYWERTRWKVSGERQRESAQQGSTLVGLFANMINRHVHGYMMKIFNIQYKYFIKYIIL